VQLYVTTTAGPTYYIDVVFKNRAVKLEGRVLLADLVQLDVQGWDVIIGMDWLTMHKVTIDCETKLVTFLTPDGERITFKKSGHQVRILTISTMQAFRMLKK